MTVREFGARWCLTSRYDLIEDRLRANVRGTIDAGFEEALATAWYKALPRE